jgi:endonuclease III
VKGRDVPWDRIVRKLRLRDGGEPSVSRIARKNHEPFRVLVATMISLRTKDDVTEKAAERLLREAPDPAGLARLPEARIGRLIFPAGFYRTKAVHLRGTARLLLSEHDGRVPDDMEALLRLPGVGRKTANLVLNLGFGREAICVDTHVHRISNRVGWVSTGSPEGTEMALREVLPRRYWIEINGLLVKFGQTVCTPLSPWCGSCPIAGDCARVGVVRFRGGKEGRP